VKKDAKKRLHRPRKTVPFIVALLIASAAIRIAVGADAALAVDAEEDMAELVEAEMTCGPDDTPAALLAALQAREGRVVVRENQLDARLQALRVAEAEIDEKITALTEAESSLSELLTLADGAAEDDLSRLTAVYEQMKPQDAAALFEQMEPAFSAGFMGRMRPESAALIMTNLAPETAHLISVVLAGRNATAPVE
jgi:flagellar motility protein MotE (MotC chaperone)